MKPRQSSASRSARRIVPVALTIAGSDPSGGAGLQADLKVFHAHGVYGTAVVTLLTVQSTRSVAEVKPVAAALVTRQCRHLLDDMVIGAMKTGALGTGAVVEAVVRVARSADVPLVVDPVMVSKHGQRLLDASAQEKLMRHLLPLATLVTPNVPEAELIAGMRIRSVADARLAARQIAARANIAVLVKGGHLPGSEVVDVLRMGDREVEFRGRRVLTQHTHGTGCALSAAITANLARGLVIEDAVRAATTWLRRALRAPPAVGTGIGPIDHWAPVDDLLPRRRARG